MRVYFGTFVVSRFVFVNVLCVNVWNFCGYVDIFVVVMCFVL